MVGNFVYKTIPKILADSLGGIATQICSQNQIGFIKSHSIASLD